jgi:hypothetical protein
MTHAKARRAAAGSPAQCVAATPAGHCGRGGFGGRRVDPGCWVKRLAFLASGVCAAAHTARNACSIRAKPARRHWMAGAEHGRTRTALGALTILAGDPATFSATARRLADRSWPAPPRSALPGLCHDASRRVPFRSNSPTSRTGRERCDGRIPDAARLSRPPKSRSRDQCGVTLFYPAWRSRCPVPNWRRQRARPIPCSRRRP